MNFTAKSGKLALGIILLLLVCFLSIVFCRLGLPTRELKPNPTVDWMKALASTWVIQSPGKPYSIQTASGQKRNGDDSLRFELRGGETWVDQTFQASFRAEIATKQFPPANSVKWYAFSVFFPTNFPVEDNRLVFAQWKEKEALFGTRLVPSLAFRFVNGKFSITLRHSAEQVIADADAVPREELFKKSGFRLGQWHDFVVQAKWSCQADGWVNIWWNGKPVVEYRGPVGYREKLAPQFKFGLYRDATDQTYVAYFNHIMLGDSSKAIAFTPPMKVHSADE